MKHIEEAKNIVIEMFRRIDGDIKIDFNFEDDKVLNVFVHTKDPQFLIGEKGQTINDIEKILKLIIRRKISEIIFIYIDINNYKKRKADYLEELALETANDVALTGIEKEFPLMTAYERRIIHITLADREDVFTESIGEGLEKKVIIKKKNN